MTPDGTSYPSPSQAEKMTRRSVLMSAAGLSVAALFPAQAQAAFAIPEVAPLDKTDYAVARRHFRTDLLRKGPAPEDALPLGTPPGAERVYYNGGPDGSIPLIAWVSQYTPSSKPRPAVLFLHGGNATGAGHWELMKPYADAGFVVMLPSLRGENGQAGAFSGFYDEVDDVLAAAQYLEQLPGVDKKHVFLAGHSIGGSLSLLTAMSRKFRAVVPISANPDAWRFFDRYKQDIRFNQDDPKEFLMRSAICFAPSLKCPTLLLRGTEESHFTARHTLLVSRVKHAGISIQERHIPGNHNGSLPGAIAESIRFFHQVAV